MTLPEALQVAGTMTAPIGAMEFIDRRSSKVGLNSGYDSLRAGLAEDYRSR